MVQKSIPAVMQELVWKTAGGCASCRPALKLLADRPLEDRDDRQSRFANERNHTNIQKDGTVTKCDRTISRQRFVLPTPGEGRPDWRILAEVGARLGPARAFAWSGPWKIYAKYAALSGVAGVLGSHFDIYDYAGIDTTSHDVQRPFTCPLSPAHKGRRFFAGGRFHWPDGKARMPAITRRAPVSMLSTDLTFRLNTGPVRDHRRTTTRSAKSPRLSQQLAESFLELHPADAAQLGIASSDLVAVANPLGRAILRAFITGGVRARSGLCPLASDGRNRLEGADRRSGSWDDRSSLGPAGEQIGGRCCAAFLRRRAGRESGAGCFACCDGEAAVVRNAARYPRQPPFWH